MKFKGESSIYHLHPLSIYYFPSYIVQEFLLNRELNYVFILQMAELQ
jgi:hypothetical protein